MARVGRVQGSADIRAGRAMIDLARGVGRQWRPDRAQARCRARPRPVRPRRRACARRPTGWCRRCSGSRRPLDLVIDGQGSWTRWRGTAALDMSGRPAARLALGADKGRYRLAGTLAPGQFLKGKLLRLTAPQVRVQGAATLEDRQLGRRADAGVAVAARGRQGRRRPCRQPLPRCAASASICCVRRPCSPT